MEVILDINKIVINFKTDNFGIAEKRNSIRPFINDYVIRRFDDYELHKKLRIIVASEQEMPNLEAEIKNRPCNELPGKLDGFHLFANDMHYIVLKDYLFAMFNSQEVKVIENLGDLCVRRDSTIYHEFLHVLLTERMRSYESHKNPPFIHLSENIFEEFMVTYQTYLNFEIFAQNYEKLQKMLLNNLQLKPNNINDIFNTVYLLVDIVATKCVAEKCDMFNVDILVFFKNCDPKLRSIYSNTVRILNMLTLDNAYKIYDEWIMMFSNQIRDLATYWNDVT